MLLALGLLGGCARGNPGLSFVNAWPFGSGAGTAAAAPGAPAVVASDDPVIVFAARAQPGQQDRVTLPGGQSATVRLVRAYAAASGRECREVVVGSGLGERSRLLCNGEGGWAEARPLLRGGAFSSAGRP
jgi:hypothetical protein